MTGSRRYLTRMCGTEMTVVMERLSVAVADVVVDVGVETTSRRSAKFEGAQGILESNKDAVINLARNCRVPT